MTYEKDKLVDRRSLAAGGIAASVAAVGLLFKEKTAKASALGEENAVLASILAQLKQAYTHAKSLKKDYYDKHIKAFNKQVKDINDTLETSREIYTATQTIQEWSGYLKDERSYAVDFIKSYFSGARDFNKLELKQYDIRRSALGKILASQRDILEQQEKADAMFSKVEKDLPDEKKDELKNSKRFGAAISNARFHSDESEIRMAALKDREKTKTKVIEASKADEKEHLELKNALNLASIKEQLEINNRLLIAANDLKEVELRLMAEQKVTSRYGEKAVDNNTSKEAIDGMQKGKWGHSPRK